MRKRKDASSTEIILSPPLERCVGAVTQMHRLRKSFAAVYFIPAGKGRIVFPPQGAGVRVIGSSCLCGCLEVMFENQLYNLFKVDLLGCRSTFINHKPAEPEPTKPVRALVVGACA
jgi:hypothetical protein